jgi:hypothetical protein
MMKLKAILESNDWARGTFNYPEYAQLSPEDKLATAVAFFRTPNAIDLTSAEVYHIILSVSRNRVRALYNLASKRLSPEQLAPTKQQVDSFFE